MKTTPLFFESILFYRGRFPFIEKHWRRICQNAILFNLRLNFEESEFYQKLISQLLDSGSIYKIRVTFQKKEQLLDIMEWMVEELEEDDIFPKNPITLSIFQSAFKPQMPNSSIKSPSQLLYHDSINFATENGCSQSIILNEKREIVETSICNIFFLRNDSIYTPPIPSGCVQGVMRQIVAETFPIRYQSIPIEDIFRFDEVFLSNAVRGIILVESIDNKLFQTFQSKEIQKRIKNMLQ